MSGLHYPNNDILSVILEYIPDNDKFKYFSALVSLSPYGKNIYNDLISEIKFKIDDISDFDGELLDNIDYLDFSNSNITNSELAKIGNMKSLFHLNLYRCNNIDETGILSLSNLSHLTYLNVGDCKNVDSAICAWIIAKKGLNLEELIITDHFITYDAMKWISSISNNLHSLDLSRCNLDVFDFGRDFERPDDYTRFSNLFNNINLSGLTHLILQNTLIHYEAMGQWVEMIPNLIYVDISYNDVELDLNSLSRTFSKVKELILNNVIFFEVEELEDVIFNEIEFLSLNESRIDGGDNPNISWLENLTTLKKLDLGSCYDRMLTDTNISVISNLTNLTDLNLSNNIITDIALESLIFLTNLRYLNLKYCAITDSGLKYLRTLTNLQILNLVECEKITENGINFLNHNLPDLTIIQK